MTSAGSVRVAVAGSSGSIGTQTLDVVRAERGRYHLEVEGGNRGDIVGQLDRLHVHLIGEEVDERCEHSGTSHRNLQRRQRLAHTDLVRLTNSQRCVAHVAGEVHRRDQRRVGRDGGHFRPFAEVHAALAGEPAIHVLGGEREQRGDNATQSDESRVQGIDGILLQGTGEVTLDATESRAVPVNVRTPDGKGIPGSNKIWFTLVDADAPEVRLKEKAVFFVPR